MKLDEYQRLARVYRLPTATGEYLLFGLAGEVGELMSLEAKLIRDGGSIDEYKHSFKKELGDILWFVAALADDANISLEEVAKANVDKLAGRAKRNTIQGSGDDR